MPERFLGDWPKDAFLPFSQGIYISGRDTVIMTHEHFAGARACLGRRCELSCYSREQDTHKVYSRFFETEGIAILTMLVSQYKIEVKEEPEFSGETFEERYARITAFDQGLTTM